MFKAFNHRPHRDVVVAKDDVARSSQADSSSFKRVSQNISVGADEDSIVGTGLGDPRCIWNRFRGFGPVPIIDRLDVADEFADGVNKAPALGAAVQKQPQRRLTTAHGASRPSRWATSVT